MSKRSTRSRTTASSGFLRPGRVMAVILMLAAAWVASEFAQKMYLSYRLDAQVQKLEAQNRQIAGANQSYQAQLQALSQPGGAEEQARLHNYVKPGEKVYAIIAPSPSPAPSPAAAAAAAASADSGPTFWDFVWHTVTAPFHK
jgi:cell division protein FtsB